MTGDVGNDGGVYMYGVDVASACDSNADNAGNGEDESEGNGEDNDSH